jgi:hypothetical protein
VQCHVKQCLNENVTLSWPKGGDPYKFPSDDSKGFPSLVIYEMCDLNLEVESILEHRFSSSNRFEFKVKWLAISHEESTWEPVDHLSNSNDVVSEYYQQYPGKMQPVS